MKFTTKILMMPLAALLALTTIFGLLWRTGTTTLQQYDLIQEEHVHALELSHKMEKLAIEIRQNLADAATVGDPDRVLEADSLAREFRSDLEEFKSIPSVDVASITVVSATFSEYYDHARNTSLRMLDQELSDDLIAEAIQMNADFEQLVDQLDVATQRRQQGIADAFDVARESLQHSGKGISLTILALLLVLLAVSFAAIASVLRPLRRLMNATEAITRGDLNANIDYDCKDEMGRLADSFRHMQTSLIADIERREKMEAAIRDSEKMYRLLADNSSDVIWTMDREGRFTYFSPSVHRHLGYTPTEAIGLTMEDLFPDTQCVEFRAATEQLFDRKNVRHDSVQDTKLLRRKDGNTIWSEITANLLIDETGEAVGLSGVARDITDRKLAQEALRESEERLRSIFMNSTLGIFRTTPQGKVIAANPAAAEMFGYEDPEETAREIDDISQELYADPEDRVWVMEALQLNGQMNAELMFRRRGADDSHFPAQLNLWTVANEDGSIRCIEGMIEDITDRRQLLEAVRQSEERLQLAFDAANDGLFDHNLKTGTMYLSPRYYSMLGYEPGDFEPSMNKVIELLHPDDFEKGPQAFEKHRKTGEPYDLEARFRHKNGEWIWIHTRGKVVEWDEDGEPLRFVGTNVDITKRKQAEEELKLAQQELLDAAHNAGMAEIATSVLHNVGNALNGAITSTTVMDKTLKHTRLSHLTRLAGLIDQHKDDLANFVATSEQGKKLPQFFNQLSEVISGEHARIKDELKSLEKSHEHIRQIIALQQQYAGMPGYKEDVYAADLVNDAVQLFGASFQRHSIKFKVDRPKNLPAVHVEKHKVLQILINLLKNARDAVRDTDRSDREITVHIHQNGTDDLKIEVKDNGVGIRDEDMQKIFGYGFTTKRDGHGYGLHGCANSAREMGGELTASSEGANKGATFTLTLPLEETEDQRARTADVE